MILEEKVEVCYSGSNIPILKDKGYLGFKQGQIIEVKVSDLSIKSSIKITAICKICESHNKISYSKYNLNVYRLGYYGCKKCSQIKLEITSLNKYGTKRPSQSNIVKKSQENTNILLYGTKSALQCESVREKTINTNYEKYGCKYAISNKEIREKSKVTMLERYGCEYSSQNVDLNKKINKVKQKWHESGLYYESSYELDFIEFCIENSISIERGPIIKYIYNSRKSTYFSDFFIKDLNLIIEVKSKYYYDKFIEKNITKMNNCICFGYNFIFLIDKNYKDLKDLLNNEI